MEEIKNQNLMQLIRKVHGLVENQDVEKQRQSQDSIGSLISARRDAEIEDTVLEAMHAEWIRPKGAHLKKYVILYCHGGGYMTGSCQYARTLTTKLAEITNFDIFCFDYGLAPEHPYPCAVKDALRAWNHLMLLGYGARDVVLAGDSAGGNLALSLALHLKDAGRRMPRGLVLLSPWTDMTLSGKTHETRAGADPILNAEYVEKAVRFYADGQDLKNPYISPLFGDFRNFPPTYIQAGENEILLDDSCALYEKMKEAQVPVRLDTFEGMWHVFQMSPFKTAGAAMEKCAEFIFGICS